MMRYSTIALAAALAGCAAGGPNTRQALEVPLQSGWSTPVPHGGAVTGLTDWWSQFNDPALVLLVQTAEDASPTMTQATARIAQARANARIDSATALPSVDGYAKLTERKNASQYRTSSIDASWEIDLFGKNKAIREGAEQRLRAAGAAWHQARVSLAAEVASTYFDYRYCVQSMEVEQAALASRKRTLDLVRVKANAGALARTDLLQVEAGVAEATNSVLSQEASCTQQIHQLTALTTVGHESLVELLAKPVENKGLPSPEAVPFRKLPADVIRQRPDLAKAQSEVLAAAADAGVAEAERYPSVRLLGSIGWSATGGSSMASTWSWGPSVSLPMFDGGRSKFAAQRALATYQESVGAWRASVLKAVKEVEDALTKLNVAHAQVEAADFALARYEEVFKSMEVKYDLGAASLLELEDARRSALAAKQSRLGLNLEHAKSRVALYKAAGGGWTPETQQN